MPSAYCLQWLLLHASLSLGCLHSDTLSHVRYHAVGAQKRYIQCDSRLEGVNTAKLKFTKLITTTSRVSVRNNNESEREGAKQIANK
jgi:hypothetical protein